MSTPALDWTEVDSGNVKAVAYEDNSKTLCVEFMGSGLYTYEGVDHDTYVSLVHAPSVGRYLSMVIKGMYPYTKHSDMLALTDSLASK